MKQLVIYYHEAVVRIDGNSDFNRRILDIMAVYVDL